MGNLFKSIASVFVEVQDDSSHVPAEVSKPVPSHVPIVTPSPSSVVQGDGIQGQLDSNLFEQLCDVLEESNIPGPDYIELTKASQNDVMKAAIPDEGARLMAAYISMKATSPDLNRGIVLGSIDKYVEILEGERKRGLCELQEKWVENIEKPEADVARAQEEIVRLQSELQERIQFVAEQKAKIADARNEHGIKKANFNYTFDVFIKKLLDDKVKLEGIIQD